MTDSSKDRPILLITTTVAAVLIVLVTIAQGLYTERWSSTTSADILAMAKGLENVPVDVVGDWSGQRGEDTMSDDVREAAGAVGYLDATYTNSKTADRVTVYMICGPSRSVSIHTPDACYPGAGFTMEEEPKSQSLADGDVSLAFTTCVFHKSDAGGTQRLRLFWAWSPDGKWESPKWPRLKYGGRRALAKIYLICNAPLNQPPDESPALLFAKEFLPLATDAIFPERTIEASPTPPEQETPAETN